MKFFFFLFILFTTILTINSQVQAQYTGPSATGADITVAEVFENAQRLDRQDVKVRLRGYLVEHIRAEYFWFYDGTGRIRVEIYPRVMPDRPFDETTELILVGEVDFHLLNGSEIEVDHLLFAAEFDAEMARKVRVE